VYVGRSVFSDKSPWHSIFSLSQLRQHLPKQRFFSNRIIRGPKSEGNDMIGLAETSYGVGETVPDIESGTVVQYCMCRALSKHPAPPASKPSSQDEGWVTRKDRILRVQGPVSVFQTVPRLTMSCLSDSPVYGSCHQYLFHQNTGLETGHWCLDMVWTEKTLAPKMER
jgi:hypothetical protein